MKFWVREERVSWKGRQGRKEPGLRKGEEVLNHYCDIDLDVKERREWGRWGIRRALQVQKMPVGGNSREGDCRERSGETLDLVPC